MKFTIETLTYSTCNKETNKQFRVWRQFRVGRQMLKGAAQAELEVDEEEYGRV